jgi:hypothetical protein
VLWSRAAAGIERKHVRLITLHERKRSDAHSVLPQSGEFGRIDPEDTRRNLRVDLKNDQHRGSEDDTPRRPTNSNTHLVETARDL